MASPTASTRQVNDERTYHAGELPAPVLSLLTQSLVIHSGSERAVYATLAEAVAVLPISAADAVRLLGPVAASGEVAPPFTMGAGSDATMLFLTPMFPALRELSVRDAVRAWVLVDLLCLAAPARRLEHDLIQRYAEDPSAEGDWRAAFTVEAAPRVTRCGNWSRAATAVFAPRYAQSSISPFPTSSESCRTPSTELSGWNGRAASAWSC